MFPDKALASWSDYHFRIDVSALLGFWFKGSKRIAPLAKSK
jgi:hypothetical protein